jgi:cytochrome P450
VVVLEHFTKQWSVWRLFSNLLPSPGTRRFEQVVRRLDEFIYGVIRERRASGKDAGDLLSMLLQARDEHGQGMNDCQLRDELTTLIVAGLDTTALALSWAFYLLSQNLAAADKLFAELQTVLEGRAPRFTDLPQLRYTEMIVKETMRLYPSAWLIGREAIHDCEIGGHRITSLIMSQWRLQDPRCSRKSRKIRSGAGPTNLLKRCQNTPTPLVAAHDCRHSSR